MSLESRETVCANGLWSNELICVKPGAMLIVGGRSDTYGVLSSVELITSGNFSYIFLIYKQKLLCYCPV